ncbi:MAG: TIR domain-containing protein [Proteobacteria bacterium]|nr:TIR domain-containing protein [Pseudomonadota bacterium]
MADVFISYSHHDAERVAPIASALKELGLSVWYDPNLKPGQDYERVIADQLSDAKAIIVCWSLKSVESRWVKGEASFADDQGLMVPVRLDDCRLPLPFGVLHREDLINWSGDATQKAWRSILERIGQLVTRPGLGPLNDARASGDPLRMRVWAEQYPDDPMARGAADRWKDEERQTFDVQAAEAKRQLDSYFRQKQSLAKSELASCEKAFDAWLKTGSTANIDKRPNPSELVTRLLTPPDDGRTQGALDRAEKAEAEAKRLSGIVAELENRPVSAPPPPPGGAARMAMLALVGLIGIGGGYYGGLKHAPGDPELKAPIGTTNGVLQQAVVRACEVDESAKVLQQQVQALNSDAAESRTRIASLESDLRVAEQGRQTAEVRLRDTEQRASIGATTNSFSGGTNTVPPTPSLPQPNVPPAVASLTLPATPMVASAINQLDNATAQRFCTLSAGQKFDRDNTSREGEDDVNDLPEARIREAIGTCNRALNGASGTTRRRMLAQLGRVQAGFAVLKAKMGDSKLAGSAMNDARQSWQQAASSGSAYAMNQLGAFYYGTFGREVDRSTPDYFGDRDESLAIRYWRDAANANFPPALANVAAMLLNRSGPLQVDPATAVAYADRAISFGYARAYIVKADGVMGGLIEPSLSTTEKRRLAARLAHSAGCAGETRLADKYFEDNRPLNNYRPSSC